ncbi:hypothetical protein GCM10025298_27690 [Natronobiforma cellulositropha]
MHSAETVLLASFRSAVRAATRLVQIASVRFTHWLAPAVLTPFVPRVAHQFVARAGRDLNTRSDVLTHGFAVRNRGREATAFSFRATSLRFKSRRIRYPPLAELLAVRNGPGAI